MRKNQGLAYIKRVKAKGRTYCYFDTGLVENGKKKFVRLPDRSDPSFARVYAAMLGHRSRRAEVVTELKLSQLLTRYEQSPKFRKLAASSQRNYSHYLGVLCDSLGDPPAARIERRDVVAVLDAMADRPGASNLMLRVTSALFAWARRHTEVVIDPCKDIDLHEVGEHQAWPEGLLDEALEADDPRVRLAVSLLYYTAQRIGDVCKMTWGDIKDGEIHVVQQKTGTELYIRLHRSLAALLDSLPKPATLAWARKARILDYAPNTVREWLVRFAAERGVHAVPHGLRKNAVIALLEAGCSTAETASISGQSLQMIEYYARQRNQRRLGSGAVLKWEKRR